MGIKDLVKDLGKVVLVPADGIKYEARIIDIKVSYGRPLYLIEPVAGCGSKWIADYVHKGY